MGRRSRRDLDAVYEGCLGVRGVCPLGAMDLMYTRLALPGNRLDEESKWAFCR